MGNRIYSIDSLRAVAVFFVVIAHVRPFVGFGPYGNYAYFVLDTIGQFDVPFFFVTAGYFLATKINSDDVRSYVRGAARKIGSLYLFGILLQISAVALAAGIAFFYRGDVMTRRVTRLLGGLSPVGVLYYGDAISPPLWFLTALFFSICLIAVFVAFGADRYLLPVALTVHVLGLLGQNYPMFVELSLPTRDALFFGFFYVALGYQVRSSDWAPKEAHSRRYLGAFGLFVVLQLSEQYLVNFVLRGVTLSQTTYTTEYTVSTVFLVLALFAYALSAPQWTRDTFLPKLGTYAVGVYLVHFPVLLVLKALMRLLRSETGIDLAATLLWQIAVTPFVYGVSLALYALAARVGLIEIGGSHVPRLSRIRARLGASESDAASTAD